jgi:hypothetical protein
MQDYQTIKPHPQGRWAISRPVSPGVTVYLIERTPVSDESIITLVLTYLGYAPTPALVDEFFPRNSEGRRCPTFALMKRFCERKYEGAGVVDPLRSVGV